MNKKEKKYIVVSRKVFEDYSSAACPFLGQIATNSKFIAYTLFKILRIYSNLNYGTIAPALIKKNNEGTYDAIIR